MNARRCITAVLCTLCAGLLLAACRGSATPAGGDAAAWAAKPGGPIALRHELLETPALGLPLRVRVTATARRDVSALTIRAHPGAALVLTEAPSAPPADVAAGETLTRTFTVHVMEAGRHELSVVAEGRMEGEPQAAQLTVPVRVGGSAAVRSAGSAAGVRATDAAAEGADQPRSERERVHSLPARER